MHSDSHDDDDDDDDDYDNGSTLGLVQRLARTQIFGWKFAANDWATAIP